MIEAFSYSQSFFFGTVSIVGLIIGSFLNVVVYRLPKILNNRWRRDCLNFLELPIDRSEEISISKPGSHCPHCKISIKPWENIPVLSYIFLRGRCSSCSETISLRYPGVELITALFTLLLGYQLGPTTEFLAAIIFTWMLIALSLIDLDHQLLPDDITLPLLWLGLLVNLYSVFVPLHSAVIGAVLGYGLLWVVYWTFKLCTGKEGMGFGDFKLLAALGAWLGWEALPMIILLASTAGASVGIFQIIFKYIDKETPIPFGPYLATAGLLALLIGPENDILSILALPLAL